MATSTSSDDGDLDQAGTSDVTEPAVAPWDVDGFEPERRSFWTSFEQADMKLFLVTFTGTVAANVVTVIVVALAIVVAHSNFLAFRVGTGSVIAALVIVVLAIFVVWFAAMAFRQTEILALKAAVVVSAAIMATGSSLFLLAVLGVAAGIK